MLFEMFTSPFEMAIVPGSSEFSQISTLPPETTKSLMLLRSNHVLRHSTSPAVTRT